MAQRKSVVNVLKIFFNSKNLAEYNKVYMSSTLSENMVVIVGE